MRAQFVIPVIVSILILGTLGLSQEALAAIHEGPPLNNPTEEYVYVGSATVDFDGFPNDLSGNGEITGNEFIAQGVVFSTPDLNLNIGGTVGSPPNSLGADKTSVNDFDGDIVFEFIDECVSSDVEFLISNPPFSATAFDINGNPLATLVGSPFAETFSFVGLPVHKVQISGSFYAIDDLTFTLECIPPPPPPGSISADHYLGYDAKRPKDEPKFEKFTVELSDQFEPDPTSYTVDKPDRLYNPVQKTHDGTTTDITDFESHYVGYKIKTPKGDPKFEKVTNVLVQNQFGDIIVDVKKPKLLLVPSAKDHFTTPDPLDLPITVNHFKCYDVKESEGTPKFEKLIVSVFDPNFEITQDFEVKKPKMLCTPVDKDGEGIVDGENHLMCYDVKKLKDDPKFEKLSVFTNNQFGPEDLEVKKVKQLCLPSIKTLP